MLYIYIQKYQSEQKSDKFQQNLAQENCGRICYQFCLCLNEESELCLDGFLTGCRVKILGQNENI